ncbi:MAG: bifunctional ADP-dependent NAD(P)H-hydrate dehydratase/NAD(P)H-hydrate epimerase [Bacteroidetes bacterium]|nr:MAG: bifunctional ADP-dependent NAD(P)H-hydrate dehydratase/NAD(P)H-hydrate epimerase [Bacteroidota bacterium]
MKVFSAVQMKEWDQATIQNESIDSIHLMERAAIKCSEWILRNISAEKEILVFCGKGNNGGDGLCIARILLQHDRRLKTYILDTQNKSSPDFSANLKRLEKLSGDIGMIEKSSDFPSIPPSTIVIDALFGYGLSRKADGLAAELIVHVNQSGAYVISVDVPSGLFTDQSSKGGTIIKANTTLTFQTTKLAFLLGENDPYVGDVFTLDIALDEKYYTQTPSRFEVVHESLVKSIYRPRKKYSNKGNFGSVVLIAGSYGMMGAAVLSAKACLRAGAGKLTCYIPGAGYSIMQTTIPEAMCIADKEDRYISSFTTDHTFDVYGVGPGLGTHSETINMLEDLLLNADGPLVIDADALNLLASRKDLLQHIPANSIITPHPKEFERLFGSSENDFDRLDLALAKASELNIIIILKGYHSFIATPNDKGFFNSTGNPGMSTAGSGDVLTGMIAGFLAQKYSPTQAAMLGAYLHGAAGDIAASKLSQEGMIASDIIKYLPSTFLKLFTKNS